MLAGYGAPPGAVPGVSNLTMCPLDTWRSGDAAFSPAAGAPCAPCPAPMQTREEGAGSEAACLAPPGYGYANGSAYVCPVGSFSAGARGVGWREGMAQGWAARRGSGVGAEIAHAPAVWQPESRACCAAALQDAACRRLAAPVAAACPARLLGPAACCGLACAQPAPLPPPTPTFPPQAGAARRANAAAAAA